MAIFRDNRDFDTTVSTVLPFLAFMGLGAVLVILDVALKPDANADRYLGRDIVLYLFGAISNWISQIMASHHGKKMAEIQNQKNGMNQNGESRR